MVVRSACVIASALLAAGLLAAAIEVAAQGRSDLVRSALSRGVEHQPKLEPEVEFVEPNWIYRHTSTTNDPYYLDGSLLGIYGDTNQTTAGPSNRYGTGALALFASRNAPSDGQAGPDRTAAIRGAVLGSTISTYSLAGKTTTGGRLDVSGF